MDVRVYCSFHFHPLQQEAHKYARYNLVGREHEHGVFRNLLGSQKGLRGVCFKFASQVTILEPMVEEKGEKDIPFCYQRYYNSLEPYPEYSKNSIMSRKKELQPLNSHRLSRENDQFKSQNTRTYLQKNCLFISLFPASISVCFRSK